MRFLCDEMLGGLARLLRAAGHDVRLAPARTPDGEVANVACEDDRLLLTRDVDLAAAAGRRGLRLRAETVDAQAAELSARIDVDWLSASFTRCLLDNAPLRPATVAENASMPGDTGALPGPFTACPVCGRTYWPGSHVRRLHEKLAALARERDNRATKTPAAQPNASP